MPDAIIGHFRSKDETGMSAGNMHTMTEKPSGIVTDVKTASDCVFAGNVTLRCVMFKRPAAFGGYHQTGGLC
ncbi:MAG: hypothetical protein HQK89_13280 [Nitrospirae bacterium]|nr:hypothetical protein [Nitrospirota bacterium]